MVLGDISLKHILLSVKFAKIFKSYACFRQWLWPPALGFPIRHKRQSLADFLQVRKMYTISKCTECTIPWKVISMYGMKELPACWEIEEIPKA